jgi:dipeptidyl aminopeptidase/acylaminoacyl peptidase
MYGGSYGGFITLMAVDKKTMSLNQVLHYAL